MAVMVAATKEAAKEAAGKGAAATEAASRVGEAKGVVAMAAAKEEVETEAAEMEEATTAAVAAAVVALQPLHASSAPPDGALGAAASGLAAFRASLERGVAALAHANATADLDAADAAVSALLGCGGRRLCTGVGKSGLAAARLASSLSSIGLAAAYVHAAEWEHGELGGVRVGLYEMFF